MHANTFLVAPDPDGPQQIIRSPRETPEKMRRSATPKASHKKISLVDVDSYVGKINKLQVNQKTGNPVNKSIRNT